MVVGLLMVVGGAAAGLFGSLLGLGGGILVVPLLTLGFGLPLRDAVGVSLVAVIVTSSASAGVYLERHVANLRLGMSLEVFTVIGALVGGAVAFVLDERSLAALFSALLVYTALAMARRRETAVPGATSTLPGGEAGPSGSGSWAERISGPDYRVRNIAIGSTGAFGAGVASALLGIGGGVIKVPVMHLLMGVPLRVATATSNLMIGVTAAASAVVYLARGGVDPLVAGPTALGVFAGASLGSRVAHRLDLRLLRFLFVAVLLYTATQMIGRALGAA